MKIGLNTYIAAKELNLLYSIPATFESLELISRANTELVQSIYDSKPILGEGEVFIETISIKILLATKSILEIGKGTDVSFLTKKRQVKLLDFPSINILTRSIIESFLTLEYLFYNNLSDNEKKFRFRIWQISGYKARQKFFEKRNGLNPNVSEKLNKELLEIERLMTIIENSPYYKKLDSQSLWKLDKYGLPRLDSWQKLIEQSILKSSLFETTYKLFSNYSHSEFISLIQMREKNSLIMNSKENNDAILTALRIVKIVNCVSIVCFKNKFDFASKIFEKFDDKTKTTILFWNKFGINQQNNADNNGYR